MPERPKKPAKTGRRKVPLDPALPIYQIKMTLNHVEPDIWRRVQTNDCSLRELHAIIQVSMGWEDCHAYGFDVAGLHHTDPEIADLDDRDSEATLLSDLIEKREYKFLYEYDFGDSWIHTVQIEKALPAEEGAYYPRCVAGERACPPEDCGGPWGYQELLVAVEDPDHEDHEETLEWWGDLDPGHLDLDAVNDELRHLRQWLGATKGKYTPQARFAEGDQVRVRSGTLHADYQDIPLGGWTGRIARVAYLTPAACLVQWSPETLESVHPVYRKRCQRDRTDAEEYWLEEGKLEPDPGGPLSVEQPAEIITRPLSGDDRDDRVRAVFGLTTDDALPDVTQETQRTYGEYLKAELSFPFEAEVWVEQVGTGQATQCVTVLGLCDLDEIDDARGLLSEVLAGEDRRQVPLTELSLPEDDPQFQPVDDYGYWLYDAREYFEDEEYDDEDEEYGYYEDEEYGYDEDEDDFEDEYESRGPPEFPVGTVALYGPDDETTTKIAAGVIKEEGAAPIIERWVGTGVVENPKVHRQIRQFFKKHGVKSVVMSDGNMGCPHEEGKDFPAGEDCPFCPFWKGKQGSARQD